ncbi:MAG: hypothetical protein JXR95_16020 [Deltaproteobacteria bacterium]|nr:hypothetical protein [Deltaproteobacteria bacterium]
MKIINVLILLFTLTPAFPGHSVVSKNSDIDLSLEWDTQVSRFLGNESDSRGPASFCPKTDGGKLILDQENFRILEFDSNNTYSGYIPLPSSTFNYIGQKNDEYIILLDTLVSQAMYILNFHGEILNEIDLEGRYIPKSGFITGLLTGDDGIYVEISHRYSVRILNRNMKDVKRTIVRGRIVSGYSSVICSFSGNSINISRQPYNSDNHSKTKRIFSANTINRIIHVQDYTNGTVIIFSEVEFSKSYPYAVEMQRNTIVFLNRNLEEKARFYSYNMLGLMDQKTEFTVHTDGTVHQMYYGETGLEFYSWKRGEI